MLTTPLLPTSLLSTARVVIDWSEEAFENVSADTERGIASLLCWAQSYPHRSAIHVFLPSGKPASRVQSLRRSLQSLGCTVTARVSRSDALRPQLRGFAHAEWR